MECNTTFRNEKHILLGSITLSGTYFSKVILTLDMKRITSVIHFNDYIIVFYINFLFVMLICLRDPISREFKWSLNHLEKN